ncbi:MAG: hypothetical protein R2697_12535 [Ilumatobacteraceae bacterium]
MQHLRRLLAGSLAALLTAPVAAAFPLTPTVSAAEQPAASAATFEWSMPDRFGLDTNGDHVIDEIDLDTPTSFTQPTSWRIDFDACAGGAPTPGATYQWTFAGTIAEPTTSCTTSHQFPAVDTTYEVVLTVTVGGVPTTSVQTIFPRDHVIVAMGDSGASGEGNPDYLHADFTAGGFGSVVFEPKWNDEQCHRSALAGPAQAALRLEQRDPHSSVTFVHTACSGARITRGILGTYQGIEPTKARLDCDDPNLANPYREGETFFFVQPDPALDAPTPDDPACLPSQLDQVEQILGDRQIDIVNVLIGINDLSFSKVAFSCLADDDCSTDRSTFLRDRNNRMITATEFLAPRKAQLPDRYRALSDALMTRLDLREADPSASIPAGHVFYNEYPNATIADDGVTVCASNEKSFTGTFPAWARTALDGFLTGLTVDPDAGTISQPEWTWAGAAITDFLNSARNDAVAAANEVYPGRFSAVTGSHAAFTGHGYCARDKWFRSVLESLLYQRDPEGSLHPNRAGHFYAYALPLEDAWAAQLGVDAPELPPTVPGQIETFEGISQSFAPLFEVLSRTDIAAELDRLFPLDAADLGSTPGAAAGPGFLHYFKLAVKGLSDHIATSLTSKGIAELDAELDQLDSTIGPLELEVEAQISPHDLTDHYEAVLDVSLTGSLGELSLDVGGLALAGPETEVSVTTELTFVIEPQRTVDRVYLRAADHPAFRFAVTATETLPPDQPVTGRLGLLAVEAHGPSDGPAVRVETALELRPRDVDHDGEISSDELVGGSFAGNFDVVCDPTSSVDVDVTLGAAIAGLGSDLAHLTLHDDNVCDGVAEPVLEFATPDLASLETLGPDQVLELFSAIALALDELQAAADVPLPFSAADLQDAVEVARQIRTTVEQLRNGATPPSLQQVLHELETALGVPPGTFGLRYVPAARRLEFDLGYSTSVTDATVEADLDLLDRVGIEATTDATLAVDGSATVDLTIGVDLAPEPDGTSTDDLRTLGDRLLVSSDAAITVDGQVTLDIDAAGRIGFVPVSLAVGDATGAPIDLLTKPNGSAPMFRLGIVDTTDEFVSLTDLLDGSPNGPSISADVNVGINPVTTRAVATLDGTELASGMVTVRWNDLSQTTGPNGPQVQADAAFGRDLLRFAGQANDPIQMVSMLLGGARDAARSVVRVARENEELARALPLVGAGFDDTVAGFTTVADSIDRVLALHRDLTLPEVEAAVEQAVADALGIPVEQVAPVIAFEIDRSSPRTALVLHLDLCQASEVSAACGSARPVAGTFTIDADGLGVVGVDGAVALQLDYLAALRLDIALELPEVVVGSSQTLPSIKPGEAPARVVILGSTGAEVELGGDVDLNASPTGTFRIRRAGRGLLGVVGTKAGEPFSDAATASASVRFAVNAGGDPAARYTPTEWIAAVGNRLAAGQVTDRSVGVDPCDVSDAEPGGMRDAADLSAHRLGRRRRQGRHRVGAARHRPRRLDRR